MERRCEERERQEAERQEAERQEAQRKKPDDEEQAKESSPQLLEEKKVLEEAARIGNDVPRSTPCFERAPTLYSSLRDVCRGTHPCKFVCFCTCTFQCACVHV